jgi:hypothetical protein
VAEYAVAGLDADVAEAGKQQLYVQLARCSRIPLADIAAVVMGQQLLARSRSLRPALAHPQRARDRHSVSAHRMSRTKRAKPNSRSETN